MLLSPRIITVALFFILPLSVFSADGNPARGRRIFNAQCAACHTSTTENRITGPALAGIVGRKAGTLEGFAFSEAMKKSGLTWDTDTLDKYLAAPTTVVPGTTMPLAVASAPSRADLISFLNTLSPAASPGTAEPAK